MKRPPKEPDRGYPSSSAPATSVKKIAVSERVGARGKLPAQRLASILVFARLDRLFNKSVLRRQTDVPGWHNICLLVDPSIYGKYLGIVRRSASGWKNAAALSWYGAITYSR